MTQHMRYDLLKTEPNWMCIDSEKRAKDFNDWYLTAQFRARPHKEPRVTVLEIVGPYLDGHFFALSPLQRILPDLGTIIIRDSKLHLSGSSMSPYLEIRVLHSIVSIKDSINWIAAEEESLLLASRCSHINLSGHAHCVAADCSIFTRGACSVEAHGLTRIDSWSSVRARLFDSSTCHADSPELVELHDTSSARVLCGTVHAYDNSRVLADRSTVYLHGAAKARLFDEECTVHVDTTTGTTTNTTINNENVFPAALTPEQYCKWFGVQVRDGHAILYKVVGLDNTPYFYSAAGVTYEVGKEYTTGVDKNIHEDCSYGIHAAPLSVCLQMAGELQWGTEFKVYEVSIPLDSMVVPYGTEGKVRTSRMKVLRELPPLSSLMTKIPDTFPDVHV